jgi:hypothetical protein
MQFSDKYENGYGFVYATTTLRIPLFRVHDHDSGLIIPALQVDIHHFVIFHPLNHNATIPNRSL